MKWYQPFKRAQQDPRSFGPQENQSNFGTSTVDIAGSEPRAFDIPGVEGTINLNVSVQVVKEQLEKAFGSNFFYPITNIRITSLPGKFGLTESNEPHTIYLNEQAMIDAVKNAVVNEANIAAQKGIKAKFTPEIGNRINMEIAKELWETIPHERQHALDFQAELQKLYTTGHGDVSSVPESHGEQAGKAALSKFRWWNP